MKQGQWSQAHKQIYNRMAEKGVSLTQSKSKTSTRLKRGDGTLRAVHEQIPTKLNVLRQHCKEEQTHILPQRCEKLIKSYRKLLLQVIAAKAGSTGNCIVGCT